MLYPIKPQIIQVKCDVIKLISFLAKLQSLESNDEENHVMRDMMNKAMLATGIQDQLK